MQVNTGYYRLLQVTSGYYRLPQVTKCYYRLLQITTGYYRLLHVTKGYYKLLQIKQFTASYYAHTHTHTHIKGNPPKSGDALVFVYPNMVTICTVCVYLPGKSMH